jgi:hypothetical protein
MECPVPGGSVLLPTSGAPCPSPTALSADVYVSWNDNGICFSADVSDDSPTFTQSSPGPFADVPEEAVASAVIITTDNSYTLYVNGSEIGSDNDWRQAHSFTSLPLLPGDNVIAIECHDMGVGPGAMLADVKVGGNSLSTSSQWKIATSVGAAWKDVNFDDSSWAAATEYGSYGVGPWLTDVSDMPLSTDSRWVWTPDYVNDNVAYFRFSFVLEAELPGGQPFAGQDVFQLCFNPNGTSTVFDDGGGIAGSGGIWDIVVETGDGAGPYAYRHGGGLLFPGQSASIEVAGTWDASGYVVETCIPWNIAMDDGAYATSVGDIHGMGLILLSCNGPTATLYTSFGSGANTIRQPATWPLVQLGVGEEDTAPPVITCPQDINVDCTSPSGAPVNFSASATDVLDPGPTIECAPAAGSTFPVGVTLVTCTATDASDNSSFCTFTVTVGCTFQLPGDCNQDGSLDLSDSVCTLGVLFNGIPPLFPCAAGLPTDAGNVALIDWQPDGSIDLSDAVGLLQFLFSGAAAHPLAVPGSETTECVAIAGCADNSNCP